MPYGTWLLAALIALGGPSDLWAAAMPDKPYLSTIGISEPSDELVGTATVLYFSPTPQATEAEAMEKTGGIIREMGKEPIFVKTEEITSQEIVAGVGRNDFCRRLGGINRMQPLFQPLYIGVVVVWENVPSATDTLTKSADTAAVVVIAPDLATAKLLMIEKIRTRQTSEIAAHGVYENSSTWEIPPDMEMRIFIDACLTPT